MTKEKKISFLMSKEQMQKLDDFLTVETNGEKISILSRSDFFRILLDDAFQKSNHVLDYLKNRRKERKRKRKI